MRLGNYYFSVITRRNGVGTILTLILIGASIYKSISITSGLFIDVASLLAGYLIIDQLEFHKHQDEDR
ncbi:DUF2198 family protein [Staphylococcus aureus]